MTDVFLVLFASLSLGYLFGVQCGVIGFALAVLLVNVDRLAGVVRGLLRGSRRRF